MTIQQATMITEAADTHVDLVENETVLFVDDEPRILSAIRRLIRPLGLKAYFAESGADGLQILKEHHIDLVVSDMRMPEMDGAQFLTEVKKQWPDTVRMLLTGYADISSTIEALNNGGIYRYISKPWDDIELKKIIGDGLKIRRLEREKRELQCLTQLQNDQLQDLNKNLEQKVEARTEEIRQTADMLDLAYQQLKESYDSFVRVFSSFISSRETLKGLPQSVADISTKIAVALKLNETETKDIYYASLLHEVGKLSLPDETLTKPERKLTQNDREQYHNYPLMGEMALTAISGLEQTALLIRTHGECLDGSGFPGGLKGDQIPKGAQIIRMVRDFIGLQTGLIDIERLSIDEAMDQIKKVAGKKYDKNLVHWLEQFKNDLDLAGEFINEIKVECHSLVEGMRLSRDLLNANGILLIAKGHTLTENIIDKVMTVEKLEKKKLHFYIEK